VGQSGRVTAVEYEPDLANRDRGKLILPLTPDEGVGAVFWIQRRGDGYFASWICPIMIYRCVGARDEASEHALAKALQNGGAKNVTRLYRLACRASLAYHWQILGTVG
jgi:hypothetical protein